MKAGSYMEGKHVVVKKAKYRYDVFWRQRKPIKLLNISCNSLESRFLLSLYIYFDDDVDGSVVP